MFEFILKAKADGEAEKEKGQQASSSSQGEHARPETEELEQMALEREGDQTDPGRKGEPTDLEKENDQAAAATPSSSVNWLEYSMNPYTTFCFPC